MVNKGLAAAESEQQSGGLLDDLFTGITNAVASLTGSIDGLRRETSADRIRRNGISQHIYPIDFPSGYQKADGSGNLLIASAELFGPRTGVYWAVHRVTVSGLTSNDIVYLYKVGTPNNQSAQGNNVICQFAASAHGSTSAIQTFGKAQLLLEAGTSLMVSSQYNQSGTITASESIFVTWGGISIDAPYMGDYLI